MLAAERPWLKPLGLLYGELMALRNHAYDSGWLKINKVSCPVIAIGNLSVGGTGKTPLTLELARKLSEQGHKVGLVSRGYKGKVTSFARVSGKDPEIHGDEPTLMAQRLPHIPVYVGADRVKVANELIKREQVNMIVADDAFQHRRLARDLDLLIVDVTQPRQSLYPLPWGLGREKSWRASQAHFIFFNKLNLAKRENLVEWKIWREQFAPKVPVVGVDYVAGPLQNLEGRVMSDVQWSAGAAVLTALAQPQSFLNMLQKNFSITINKQFLFMDHYHFTSTDLDKVSQQIGKEWLLLTEKDAVKLKRLKHPLSQQMLVVPLQLQFREGWEAFNAALNRLGR